MAFIGAKPTNVPLTSADIQDGTINTADIADGAVTSVKTTGVGGTNTPAFHSYLASNQTSIAGSQNVKVSIATEVLDTDNNFASNRFTPTTAGKYLCSFTVESSWGGSVGGYVITSQFYKNGAGVPTVLRRITFHDYYNNGNLDLILGQSQTAIVEFNGSSDYLEVYHNSNAATPYIEVGSNFGAFKLIE